MTQPDFVWHYIQPLDEDVVKGIALSTQYLEYSKEWRLEMEHLGYAHRWLVKGQDLPKPIRQKIIDWVRMNNEPFYKKNFEILAQALEKNDPYLIKPKEKQKEMEI
jgi:hypothetical protein